MGFRDIRKSKNEKMLGTAAVAVLASWFGLNQVNPETVMNAVLKYWDAEPSHSFVLNTSGSEVTFYTYNNDAPMKLGTTRKTTIAHEQLGTVIPSLQNTCKVYPNNKNPPGIINKNEVWEWNGQRWIPLEL